MTNQNKLYGVPSEVKKNSLITFEEYKEKYKQSIQDPENFWSSQANSLKWIKKFHNVRNYSFHSKVSIKWFEGGKLNASYNCLDRHLEKNSNKIAIIWEGDNPKDNKTFTYKELHHDVCKFANALKKLGVK